MTPAINPSIKSRKFLVDLFQVSIIFFPLFYLMETWRRGSIGFFFPLDDFFWFLAILGTLLIFSQPSSESKSVLDQRVNILDETPSPSAGAPYGWTTRIPPTLTQSIGAKGFIDLFFLAILSALLAKSTTLTLAESFQIVFAVSFLLILPGWVWGKVIFPSGNFPFPERILLSILLSLGLAIPTFFFFNVFDVPLKTPNIIFEILFITLIGVITYKMTRKGGSLFGFNV